MNASALRILFNAGRRLAAEAADEAQAQPGAGEHEEHPHAELDGQIPNVEVRLVHPALAAAAPGAAGHGGALAQR